jgi:hypothetical protein
MFIPSYGNIKLIDLGNVTHENEHHSTTINTRYIFKYIYQHKIIILKHLKNIQINYNLKIDNIEPQKLF